MKARKVLIPTKRSKCYVGVVDGVVKAWFQPFGPGTANLAFAEASDWLKAEPQADLFLITTEAKAVRVQQVSEWWEVVRREGREWVCAVHRNATCPTCFGAGRVLKSRKCPRCHGEGGITLPLRFRTRAEAEARRDEPTAVLGLDALPERTKWRVRRVPS